MPLPDKVIAQCSHGYNHIDTVHSIHHHNHIRNVFVFDSTGQMAEDPKPPAFLTRSGLSAHQWLVGTLVEANCANVRAVGVPPAIVLVVVGLRVVGGVKGRKRRVVRTTPHFVVHRQNGLDRKKNTRIHGR